MIKRIKELFKSMDIYLTDEIKENVLLYLDGHITKKGRMVITIQLGVATTISILRLLPLVSFK